MLKSKELLEIMFLSSSFDLCIAGFCKDSWDDFFELWDEDEADPNNDEAVCIVG